MEMFLTVVGLSLLTLLVSATLFAAAMPRQQDAEPAPGRLSAVKGQRFFAEDVRPPVSLPADVPIEILLLQLERHIRLEQAAAESFHFSPTSEALHMHTASPLVH